MRPNPIKRLLRAGKPAVGTWLTLGSVLAARFPARALNFAATPTDYYAKVNDELLIVLQCEHIQAVRDFDAVFSVPGIDAVFVGPNDLARSMHTADGKPPSPEAFKQALADILAGCKRNKVAAGIHTFGAEEARLRIADGWQFIAVGSELKMMVEGAKSVTDALGLKPAGDLA